MNAIEHTAALIKLSGFTRRKVVLSGASIATLAAGIPLAGCGGGALVPALAPGGLASFAPFFVFTYLGVVERKIISVNFLRDQASAGKNSGNFETSKIRVDNNQPNDFSGSFKERELEITIVQPLAPLATRYTGLFTEDETILMTPVGAGRLPFTLRLDRIDPLATRFIPALTGKWTGQDANNVPWTLLLATEPVNNDPLNDPGDPTVLLTGTETLGNAPLVPLLGHASIRYLEIDITRASGKVLLTATLQSASGPPPAGQPLTTATIVFKGGGSLRKAP